MLFRASSTSAEVLATSNRFIAALSAGAWRLAAMTQGGGGASYGGGGTLLVGFGVGGGAGGR